MWELSSWCVTFKKKYKDKITKNIKTGSGELTERTIIHLAGRSKNIMVKNSGLFVNLKFLTK